MVFFAYLWPIFFLKTINSFSILGLTYRLIDPLYYTPAMSFSFPKALQISYSSPSSSLILKNCGGDSALGGAFLRSKLFEVPLDLLPSRFKFLLA
jgi:hypothetical protein